VVFYCKYAGYPLRLYNVFAINSFIEETSNHRTMKTIQLTILSLFLPFTFFAQTLTGLWVGEVKNDSTTIRKDQSFEIVLTQYKDKVYGYSRSTFIVNDSLFYIVKRVKGTIEGDVCEVTDDEIVSYNFKGRLNKGVKMVSTFHFDHNDSVWRMDGDWKTNKTKKYYSVSGKIELAQEKDLAKSKIFPHLEELSLADDVAFYKEYKKTPEPAAIVKQQIKENKTDPVTKEVKSAVVSVKETKQADIVQTKQAPASSKKEQAAATDEKPKLVYVNNDRKKDSVTIVQTKTEPAIQTKQPVNTIKKEHPIIEEKPIVATIKNNKKDSVAVVQAKPNGVTEINQPVNDSKNNPVIKEEKISEKPKPLRSGPVVIAKPVEQKKEPVIEAAKPETKNQEPVSAAVAPKEKDKQQPVSIFEETKPSVSTTAAVFVAERKIVAPQVVMFKSDSLELALYDNGEVDGDTVSVLLNGEIILAKQGLKVSAIKKTIYMPAGTNDSMTLVLYAENLGKYPPNTGLLVIRDGDETYQVRFSADLQQNAAIVFKRKRN
jgi:hypothetical protein